MINWIWTTFYSPSRHLSFYIITLYETRRNDNVDKNNHVFAKDCVDFVLYIRLQVSTYVDCNSNITVVGILVSVMTLEVAVDVY